jgi:predicted AAA+ superfamily ATPase
MNRISENYLAKWFDSPGRKPLVIRGARQVGKSTLVRNFATTRNLVLHEINLERHTNLDPLFASFDMGRICRELEFISANGALQNGLLFLDEIQACPNAIAALRYFLEDRPDIAVIAAGSLLEFALSKKGFPMPVGRIEYHYMGPCTFNEYLDAVGEPQLSQYLQQFEFPMSHSPAAHERCLDNLRDFLLIGGMPAALAEYTRTRDINLAQRIHHSILDTFRDDFGKYSSSGNLEYLRRVFDFVPSAAGEKVKYSRINQSWKSRDVRAAIELLARAGAIYKVHHSSGAMLPLAAQTDDTVYKLFFLDTGLMNSACGIRGITIEEFRAQHFINEGKIAEQFAAQHLFFGNEPYIRPELHYWLREGRDSNAEVDFLVQAGGKIIPVEIKAGASGSLKSLHQYAAKTGCKLAVRLDLQPPSIQKVAFKTTGNINPAEASFTLLSLPLYFAGCISRIVNNLQT